MKIELRTWYVLLLSVALHSTHHQYHQDISYENILINHHGKKPQVYTSSPSEMLVKLDPEFRSTFPVRYLLIDFGYSAYFPTSTPLPECSLEPTQKGRIHKAPEVSVRRYNPFAADVYQTGRLLHSWFFVRISSYVHCLPCIHS